MPGGYVYILTNEPRGTLYIGVTNNLIRPVYEHREGLVAGFSKTYGLKMLVYYECHATMPLAIVREKQMKAWKRYWKMKRVIEFNPEWRDLFDVIAGSQPSLG
jgi:putative endonuclease